MGNENEKGEANGKWKIGKPFIFLFFYPPCASVPLLLIVHEKYPKPWLSKMKIQGVKCQPWLKADWIHLVASFRSSRRLCCGRLFPQRHLRFLFIAEELLIKYKFQFSFLFLSFPFLIIINKIFKMFIYLFIYLEHKIVSQRAITRKPCTTCDLFNFSF